MPSSPRIEMRFLGWDAPLLLTTTDYLFQEYSSNLHFDGSRLLCVLPTQHSANRMRELLQETASGRGIDWTPPEILTVGELPERLYQSPEQPALEFEQTLAWANVLQSTPSEQLLALVPTLPHSTDGAHSTDGDENSIEPWLELASTIRRLQADLSINKLTFNDVADTCEGDAEVARWKLLDQMSTRYERSLDEIDLVDPDIARRQAMARDAIGCQREIVLVGTTDLNDLLASMLRICSTKVTVLIAAPTSHADWFDEMGCVRTQCWLDHELPLSDEQLIAAGDLSDVATTAAACVNVYDCSDLSIVLGTTDTSHVGPVEMELHGLGKSTHRQIGWTVSSTSFGKLLRFVARHTRRQTWQTLAALVRHGIVAQQITQALEAEDESEWLSQLDGLMSNHYPTSIDSQLTKVALENYPLAIQVKQWCQQWLEPFTESSQPLSRWSEVMRQWMPSSDAEPPSDDPAAIRTLRAVQRSDALLQRFSDLNDRLDPIVSAEVAIEMLRGRLADLRVVLEQEPDQIPILGWLDLALDTSQAMVVMGLNHPYVPSATTSDPFLPGALRTKLKMADNERRYARDVYAMHLMLSTRSHIHFIVGKKAGDGSPTPPSRLIAAADKEDSARRIRKLFDKTRTPDIFPHENRMVHQWDKGPKQTELSIPDLFLTTQQDPYANRFGSGPSSGSGVTTMSVTAFRDYMMCPYRFYLRHVLKMKPLDDERNELAANQFGDLIHGAVETYGQCDAKSETDVKKIESALIEHLHNYADDHYGPEASTSVRLQIAQAERRLAAVARAQAERIAQGWVIHATEAVVSEKSGAVIEVNGGTMGIRGRFDRIDHHPETGQWAILDYKTHGHLPAKKHLKKVDGVEKWIDLQLPLYRLMIPYLGIDAPPDEVQLGYFNVSEKDPETKINLAEFTAEQLDQAQQEIHRCVTGVLAEDFQPAENPPEYDDYGMILQVGAFPVSTTSPTDADTSGGEQ